MIGFNDLGRNGRLGNQMFQCAGLVGIAKKRGFEYCIPDHSMYKNYGGYDHHELQGCFKMGDFEGRYGYIDGNVVHLDQYHFCEDLLNECPDNSTLIGYFESEKYFKHCENNIRKNYQFHDFIVEKCLNYGQQYLKDNPVGLVIRRGDFVIYQSRHRLCDLDYYKNALNYFDGRTILIFSDDIEWCKQQEIFNDKNIFFVDTSLGMYKGHFDLCLLSMCSDFIIANSTFAWWGAWLSTNKEKIVISPKKWFGPELEHLITKDLYLPDWILL